MSGIPVRKTLAALGISALVATGAAVATASSASAAVRYNGIRIAAPGAASAWMPFTIGCYTNQPGLHGSVARVVQNNKVINAQRVVGSNGSCTMRVASGLKGINNFSVRIVAPNGNVWVSNVVRVIVG